MMLLLDLGNTRLKWAFAHDGLRDAGACAWDADAIATFADALPGKRPPTRVLGAAVAGPARRAAVETVLAGLGWPAAEWLHSPARHGGLTNAYPRPADLGIDRFLGMLAALDAGLAPCVVASVGSALTLDAVDVRGCHLGGLIVPGAAAMLAALRIAAPGLPEPGAGPCVEFADNTRDAMRSGPAWAMTAAVERFVDAAAGRLRVTPTLLLCGGDSDRIGPLLRCRWQPLEQAVLRGLLAWSRAADHARPA